MKFNQTNEIKKNERKSLLIGASGQIGGQILALLDPARTVVTSRAGGAGCLSVDLGTIASVEDAERVLSGDDLGAIYCIAGMTAVDRCEDEPELAHAINCRGPEMLAKVAARRGLPFVYFSTEYVFDGVDGPYTEESAARPISVYGQSKWDGERAVLDAHAGALVLRTTVVYGPDRAPAEGGRQNNYLYSVMRNLRDGVKMRVPEDQVSTPSYNRDVARATVGLVERGASGVFHVCGPEVLGRLEFARGIGAELGLDVRWLEGVKTSALGQKAARPLDAGLLTEKLRREFPELEMRGLSASLADCREEIDHFLAKA